MGSRKSQRDQLNSKAINNNSHHITSVAASPSLLCDDGLPFPLVEADLEEPSSDLLGELFLFSILDFRPRLLLGACSLMSKLIGSVIFTFLVVEAFSDGDNELTCPVLFCLFSGAAVSVKSSSSLESEGTFPYSSFTFQRNKTIINKFKC